MSGYFYLSKTGTVCYGYIGNYYTAWEDPMNRYLLITTRTPQFNPADIPGHYEHLENLKLRGQLELYGPFSDTSGGAYLIKASSFEEAFALGSADPLIKSGSSTLIVKEWVTN